MNYFINGYLRPLLCVSPFLLVFVLRRNVGSWTPDSDIPYMISAVILTLIGIWRLGFSAEERRMILLSVGFESGGRAGTNI